jgi:hypothetical protein
MRGKMVDCSLFAISKQKTVSRNGVKINVSDNFSMTTRFQFLILLITGVSCKETSDKYFIGKNSKLAGLAGSDYIWQRRKVIPFRSGL